MLAAVVGINWGDEGKGRMVDLLASKFDIVARYQGGNNAGHTVVNDHGKFILNLIPSGIANEGVINVMGNGMVIDIEHLCGEIARVRDIGISVTPQNLRISDRATICMPYHRLLDVLEEERLGSHGYGSTHRGIAPVYGDKYMKKSLRMGDLLHPDTLRRKVEELVEWKNMTSVRGYGHDGVSADGIMEWLDRYGTPLIPHIIDVTPVLLADVKEGKSVLFEAQLGALRDIDFGIYPFTSSSNNIAAYAPIGAGIPGCRLDKVVGITKAYSSCVGAGPFTCELFGEEADRLREAGGEYGAATGRPRRVGPFDAVATRYGVMIQGADELALTKLDVLSMYKEIPVCEAYEIDGRRVDHFPVGDSLDKAKPVFSSVEGFNCDVSDCRRVADLPDAARRYIDYIEKASDCHVRYVSVGPGRDDYVDMDE